MVRPTARELVQAVREFLEADVLAATEGRVRYQTRVAVNVLSMVERELATDHDPDAELLRKLSANSLSELAADIRAGRLDDRYPEARAALLAATRARLEIADPGYL